MPGTERNPQAHCSRPGLAITVSDQGTTTTVSLRGEWDMAGQPAIRAAIRDVMRRSPECVVLDLTRLSFIDSTGIHDVIELQQRSARQQVRLVIVPGPPAVQHPFKILGLADQLPFLTRGSSTRAARRRSARPQAAGSGGSLPPPPATPAAESSRGRRR
jgi:anti-anti-sigma factor